MSGPLHYFREAGLTFTGITSDSRQVAPGNLFLAYPGEHADGRRFIADAIARGAAGVCWEHDGYAWPAEWTLPNQPVAHLRERAGVLADEFYGRPSRHMWVVGITGTNGKTSCSHWVAQALGELGRPTAIVGTLGNGLPGQLSDAVNTTPDPVVLHGLLAGYRQAGANGVAMEVSSHGLVQGRVSGMHFNVALLTNLTRDHLDYHGNMDAYAAAKRRLFDWPGLDWAILNADDAFGRRIAAELAGGPARVLSYGLASGDVRGSRLVADDNGLRMQVDSAGGSAELHAPHLLGRFNASNLLAVIATLLAAGVELERAVRLAGARQPVAGRMQRLGGGDLPLVVIDYAHTPDALEKVLLTLKEQARGKVICVFGCGGNRDKGKRPLMGEVASRLADSVVVTSDNPRHEDPAQIIEEIIGGMRGNYHLEPDRAAAIAMAVHMAQPRDVVLVAGKGHENYQEINGVKLPFSDVEVAQRALEVNA